MEFTAWIKIDENHNYRHSVNIGDGVLAYQVEDTRLDTIATLQFPKKADLKTDSLYTATIESQKNQEKIILGFDSQSGRLERRLLETEHKLIGQEQFFNEDEAALFEPFYFNERCSEVFKKLGIYQLDKGYKESAPFQELTDSVIKLHNKK